MAAVLVAATVASGAYAQGAPANHCTDVQVGSARSYDCLNSSFRRDVAASKPAPDTSTLTATSAAPRVGLYNQAGTREHLGANFGISAYPARPH